MATVSAVTDIVSCLKTDVLGFVGNVMGFPLLVTGGWRVGTLIADRKDFKGDLIRVLIGYGIFVAVAPLGGAGTGVVSKYAEVTTYLGEAISALSYIGTALGALLTTYYAGIIAYKLASGENDWGLALGAAIIGIFIVSASGSIKP